MSDGNRRDNAALDRFVGQFAWRPVRHWPPRFVGRFAGHREDLRDLFGRELAAATGTPQIAERFRNGLAQGGWFLGALDERQPVEGFLPAFPPDADAVPLAVEFLGDFFVVEAFESEQNDFGAVGEPLRATPREGHRLQHLLLTFGDDDLGCLPWHDISSGGSMARPLEKMAKSAPGWKAGSASMI